MGVARNGLHIAFILMNTAFSTYLTGIVSCMGGIPDNARANPKGDTGGPDPPPGKSQKYRFS